MNWTVFVGILGVVATAVTAWVASWNTRKATERTVEAGTEANRATLVGAREDRLWEKRACAYEEALTGLLHRAAQRHFEHRTYRTDAESERKLEEFYKQYELPGAFETEAGLVAYASDAALEAHKAARRAHATVKGAYSHKVALRQSIRAAQGTGLNEGLPDADTMRKADREFEAALQAADATDDELIEVIRDELRSRPKAALPLPALPAVRRRGLRRRRELDR